MNPIVAHLLEFDALANACFIPIEGNQQAARFHVVAEPVEASRRSSVAKRAEGLADRARVLCSPLLEDEAVDTTGKRLGTLQIASNPTTKCF